MKLNTKCANNLISKDFKLAKASAACVIEQKDFETFSEICEKSEFIFDFIKEKILKNLLESVSSENYKNLLEFTGIYCPDFEDFIVLGLVKFANEGLTDEILELFENGNEQQKAYCAGYFTYILDPLALAMLKSSAQSNFAPLKANCAKALRAFGDFEIFNSMLEKLNNENEAKALDAIDFLVSYGDKNAFAPIFQYMKKTNYGSNVAQNLLLLKDFYTLLDENKKETAFEIYNEILNGYPEILPLSTIMDLEIKGFVDFLTNEKINSKTATLILKTKIKFDLVDSSDNYTFDLDKNSKGEISEIVKLLNSLDCEFYQKCEDALEDEFLGDENEIINVFEIIFELNLVQYGKKIAETIENSHFIPLICEGAKTLQALGQINLIDMEKQICKMNDENSKALFKSYFN